MNKTFDSTNDYINAVIKQMSSTKKVCHSFSYSDKSTCRLPPLDSYVYSRCYKHVKPSSVSMLELISNKGKDDLCNDIDEFIFLTSKNIRSIDFVCQMCNKTIFPEKAPVTYASVYRSYFPLSILHPVGSKHKRILRKLLHSDCFQELLSNTKLIAASHLLSS